MDEIKKFFEDLKNNQWWDVFKKYIELMIALIKTVTDGDLDFAAIGAEVSDVIGNINILQ